MATIKTNKQQQQHRKYQLLARMWRNWDPCVSLVGMQTGAVTVENSMRVPQKIENRTLNDPAVQQLGLELKDGALIDICS